MSNLHVIANQLELANGVRRDKGEYLIDAELWMPPPALQKRGILYIITEIERDNRDLPLPTDKEYCQEAQMTILQEYYNFNASASITSALRHALERANQEIFNRNSATLPPNRRGVGVTCAVVRNNELFLAQMPPTQAFVAHQGQLRYFPTPPRPTNAPSDIQYTESLPIAGTRRHDAPPSLGRYVSIEPTFNRVMFDDGDVLVLCSSTLATALSDLQAERYFLNSESRAALFNLADFARAQNISDGYALSVGAKADFSTERLNQIAAERSEVIASNPRAEANPLRDAVEGVAASVSLLASKIMPSREKERERPNYTPDGFAFEGSRANVLDTEPEAPPRKRNYLEDLERATMDAHTPAPSSSASAIDPLEPAEQDPWLPRESDNLKTPPFLRGRNFDPVAASPEANFEQQQAGAFHVPNTDEINQARPHIPPASEPPRQPRQYTFTGTDASHHNPPPPPPPHPHFNETEAEPDYEPKVAWGETPSNDKRSKFNGRRKKAGVKIDTGASKPDPYFDMVGNDGYGPSLDQIKDERKLLGGRLNFGSLWVKVGAVLLGAVIILVILFAAFNTVGSGNSNKAIDLVRSAEQKRVVAQQLALTDPARARLLIKQATAELDEAAKEKKDLPEITTTRNAIRITLDNIDRVVVPGDLRLSVDLSGQGAGLKLGRAFLTPTADNFFLMDTGRSQILMLDAQSTVKTILKPGDTASGKTFAKPVVMSPRIDSVVVIDTANVAWIYNRAQNNWTASQLGGSVGWPNPVRNIDTYDGRLYVLGPAGGQILVYPSGNYAGNPSDWLDAAQVENAKLDKAAAIAIDGSIYGLSGNTVFQMARPNGKPKGEIINQFDLNSGGAINPPVNNPTQLIIGSVDFPYFFVVDAEKRVLQYQKADGAFVQQFRAAPGSKDFDNLRDVVLDEVNRKLYIVTDQRIAVFRLPAAAPLSPVVVSGTPATTVTATTTNPVSSPSPSPKR